MMILPPGFLYVNGKLHKKAKKVPFIRATERECYIIGRMHVAHSNQNKKEFARWHILLQQKRTNPGT